MTTLAEQINRRSGRMEALAYDLSEVKPGYQPTELEMNRALSLHAALKQFQRGAIPEPEAKSAAGTKSGKK
ncbi:MAG: hypothetical protein D4R73_01520 [Deltaproteobacteria bacterium]|nr:MAG: hypothetical protein D4R73_01520 [Deltaproteobacteria bacterium]